jgi:hypothetical protein
MVLVPDQRLVWGGIAVGGAGIAIYMYRKNKKQQAAAATAQQTSANAGVAGSNYAYGYGYGYGMGQQYSPYGYGYGAYGLGAYGGGSGQYGYGYYGAGVPTQVQQQATTNAQWSQAAVSALTNAGYDATTVLAALGIYLTGGNLTSDQASVINSAIAAEGYPPQPGASGYPPSLHTGGTTGGGQGGSGGGTTPGNSVTVPSVIGQSVTTAYEIISSVGLRPVAIGTQTANMKVSKTNPSAGSQVAQGSNVTISTRGYVK